MARVVRRKTLAYNTHKRIMADIVSTSGDDVLVAEDRGRHIRNRVGILKRYITGIMVTRNGNQMELLEAIESRHSVRKYTEKEIAGLPLAEIKDIIETCNEDYGLHIQLMYDGEETFGNSLLSRYCKFRGVKTYIAMVGPKSDHLFEDVGYCGEKIVLKATTVGLNTCWVMVSFSKKKSLCEVKKSESFVAAITIGYGETAGMPHKSKSFDSVCKAEGEMPDWFVSGVNCALLAPTAINEQKFMFELVDENTVKATATGSNRTKIDLGIVKYHFEIGAGMGNFEWA